MRSGILWINFKKFYLILNKNKNTRKCRFFHSLIRFCFLLSLHLYVFIVSNFLANAVGLTNWLVWVAEVISKSFFLFFSVTAITVLTTIYVYIIGIVAITLSILFYLHNFIQFYFPLQSISHLHNVFLYFLFYTYLLPLNVCNEISYFGVSKALLQSIGVADVIFNKEPLC